MSRFYAGYFIHLPTLDEIIGLMVIGKYKAYFAIGGNIAENAGGKTAVLWGTAIDNLYSYRMAMPDGTLQEVRRVDHPLRKILPEDRVRFDIVDLGTNEIRHTIALQGTDIRTPGLGKDITNKALKGLPGIQKEGTDGVITSAKFILHKAYPHSVTCCLEFFGQDMDEAVLHLYLSG